MHPTDQPVAVDRTACVRHHCLPLYPRTHSHLLRSHQVGRVLVVLVLMLTLLTVSIIFVISGILSKRYLNILRFGSGLSYSIVYSTLLVKLIFLICLNSGIYLTAAYQAVLLFFAILIQLAIGRRL